MENIYIYTIHNDIIPGISSEDNARAKIIQGKKDKALFKILKQQDLHKFPINKEKLKNDFIKYLNISTQFKSLYMVFASSEKAIVVNTGTFKTYPSMDEAFKACYKFDKNDNVRVITNAYSADTYN
jgi:hypothetical protein